MKILEEKGYRYQKHLSTGGEGEVHLVKSVDKDYIAKIFPKLSQSSFDLLSDLQQMNIPNIPKIHEIFNDQDKTIVIRDYIEGNTLYDEIKKNEYLSFKRAKAIIMKIGETLKALHHARPNPIIYRDLKPENIIVSPNGDVSLIDFGIARYYKQEATRDTVLAGTKGYTAPEVMAGMQSDPRSDVYSLGLLFYEMLTGKNILEPPYQIRPVKESDELLPAWLDGVIEKATDLNPANRYASIEAFLSALENPEETKPPKRKWLRAVIAAAAVLLMGAGLYCFAGVFKQGGYETLLDITFDDASYQDLVYLQGEKIDYGEITPVAMADLMHQGVYRLQYETAFKQSLQEGMIFHLRARVQDLPEKGTMFLLSFSPDAKIDGEKAYNIHFDNKELYGSQLRNSYGYYYQKTDGYPVLCNNQWVDMVVYLDAQGKSMKYFVAYADDGQHMAYGGARMPDEWIGSAYDIFMDLFFEYWEGEKGMDVPVSEIDFIQYASGSIKSYLRDQIPAYGQNKETIDKFIAKELELVPQDRYTRHGL